MAQTFGLAQVIWLGINVPIEKGAKVKLAGLTQKPIIVGQGVDYENVYMAGEVTATAVMVRGTSMVALYASGQGLLEVLCDTGQTYSWDDAFLVDQPEVSDGGGKMPLKWAVGPATEVLS